MRNLVAAVALATALGFVTISADTASAHGPWDVCTWDEFVGRTAAWFYGVEFEGGALCG